MTHLRAFAIVAVTAVLADACTFGDPDAQFSSNDAGASGGGGSTGGTGHLAGGAGGGGGRATGGHAGAGAGGASSGGAVSTGGNASDTGGAASTGGAPETGGASNGGGSGTGGAGTGGSTGGADAGATGGTGTGGASSGGAGGIRVDAGAPDGDAASGGSEGGGSCPPCPSGHYCDTSVFVCKPGCGSNAACASGSCSVTHDCDRCVSDTECTEGRVCSSGRCLPHCQIGTDCPTDFTCCGDRCAATAHDRGFCSSCSVSCGAGDYCGSTGCQATTVAAVCDTPHLTFLLDGAPVDDALTPDLKDAIAAQCPSAPATQTDAESASTAINPTTGQPVSGGGDIVVELGGPFSQKVAAYVESSGLSLVYDAGDATATHFYGRSSDGGTDPVLAGGSAATFSDTHDYFKIELVLDPASGTRVFQVYGLQAPGTAAAEWFFVNRVLPNLGTFTKRYYVYEWTHGDAGTNPGASDSFVLRASGG